MELLPKKSEEIWQPCTRKYIFSYFIWITILNFWTAISHKLELSLSIREINADIKPRNRSTNIKEIHSPWKKKNLIFYLSAYQVCATVKRRCFGMLLFKNILLKSLGEFRGEITGHSRGEAGEDFRVVLDFSCCNRFSLRVFTRSSFRHGFWLCALSTSGTGRLSGLVCWAMFLK